MESQNCRILAQNQMLSNNTRTTGINNNDLILGPSGAGKTRGYVIPNLLQAECSLIVADTKGSLIQEAGPALRAHGYKIIHLNFMDLMGSHGYNPLGYIRRDPRTGHYSEQDIRTVASCLAPVETSKDPFWEQSAQMYIACLIGYILECLPEEEHSLEYLMKLYQIMDSPLFDKLFKELGEEAPDSHTFRMYRLIRKGKTADRTHASIQMFLTKNLDPLSFDGALHLYRQKNQVDFRALGREKTAVFLSVSDTDRSMDRLVNLFYTQAFHILCASADQEGPGHRLPVPVRFILDDFATNVCIPDFDKLISVIRSREIYVSVILQSLSQLESLYGKARAMTIINNCDNLLYLGGQDVDTARYISLKVNRPVDSVLNLPLETAYLFTRGQRPKLVQKFDLCSHPCYYELTEAQSAQREEPVPGCTGELVID